MTDGFREKELEDRISELEKLCQEQDATIKRMAKDFEDVTSQFSKATNGEFRFHDCGKEEKDLLIESSKEVQKRLQENIDFKNKKIAGLEKRLAELRKLVDCPDIFKANERIGELEKRLEEAHEAYDKLARDFSEGLEEEITENDTFEKAYDVMESEIALSEDLTEEQ